MKLIPVSWGTKYRYLLYNMPGSSAYIDPSIRSFNKERSAYLVYNTHNYFKPYIDPPL